MTVDERYDGWWIVNTPEGVEEMGPWETKREAAEIMAGVKRWLTNREKKGWICSGA